MHSPHLDLLVTSGLPLTPEQVGGLRRAARVLRTLATTLARRRPVHALIRAVRAAGGTVETRPGRVRVVLPLGVPADDRAFLCWVLRQLVRREAPSSMTRRRR